VASHHPIRKQVAPQAPVIPDKLYFRIGEVARLCDVPAYVLRFWETEFPQLKPNKGGTGQRLYRKRDVETALRIKSLLYDQGYTIPGARQVLKSEPSAKSDPTPDATPNPVDITALSPDPQPPVDMGAAIRHDAQQRDQLANLRNDLRSLADMLSHSASDPAPAPIETKTSAARQKSPRPRLVLEPKPEPKQESKPAPRLLNQGDLFPTE
jgi:DNA-binding transcriptional MerR regulator